VRKGWFAALVLSSVLVPGAQAAERPHFHACLDAAAGARCGYVRVPLDRSNPASPKIRIGFELYRRRDRSQPALGTLVDVEGGPGYSTTDSRDYFLGLSRPLMGRRDLLLVDARGTGLSGALDCPAFRETVADYVRRAGRCAHQLGARVDSYNTRESVDDLAAALDALGIRTVDFYGDSYGSYFGQAFAVNHPDRLRSLVLDGTYPLPGTDPAYSDLAEATWRALRLVCERRPSCAARGEDPVAVLGRFLARIRAHPVRGIGTDAEGTRVRVRLDARALTTIVQSGYGDMPMYRDLIAAIRGFEAGDRAPLLRLAAENKPTTEASAARSWSEALYLAVTCHDYPQMWDAAASVATRGTQLAASRAALPPRPFSPFTGTEWTSLPYEGATACLRWPGPRRPQAPVNPSAPYPAVPTLVVNGDLDNITASSGARVVASRFPHSTFVETHNAVHVSALGDRDGCAAPLVRRFVRTLSAGDTSCAARIAEVHVADRFARRSAGLEAARSRRPGDRTTAAGRRVAASAAAMVADAIERWMLNYGGTSRGLRGGRWSWSGDQFVRFRFHRARFTRDVPVDGMATWSLRTGAVRARLTIPRRGRVRARWNLRRQLAMATLGGRVDGRRLRATMLAP
jgi:pimeloyl-ACP methyl ester carboxylesterase